MDQHRDGYSTTVTGNSLSEKENEESCQELASTRYWNENVFFNVFIIQKRERKSTESEKA